MKSPNAVADAHSSGFTTPSIVIGRPILVIRAGRFFATYRSLPVRGGGTSPFFATVISEMPPSGVGDATVGAGAAPAVLTGGTVVVCEMMVVARRKRNK